jgi:small subunit ribosomal protein S8
MVTDPLGDLLIRLKNAQAVRKEVVRMPSSRLKAEVLGVLKEEGFIHEVEPIEGKVQSLLEVNLRFLNRFRGAIQGATRVSKPGRRVYMGAEELKKWIGKRSGVWVLSTSRGIMTHNRALEQKVGGEVLLHIW